MIETTELDNVTARYIEATDVDSLHLTVESRKRLAEKLKEVVLGLV